MSLAGASDADQLAALAKLTDKIAAMPETLDDGTPPKNSMVVSGLRAARTEVVTQLSQFLQRQEPVDPTVPANYLARLASTEEQVLAHLAEEQKAPQQ